MTFSLNFLHELAAMVVQLQEWIEDRDDLSSVPIAELRWTPSASQIWIGDRIVWSYEWGRALTFAHCRDTFLEEVQTRRPFLQSGGES